MAGTSRVIVVDDGSFGAGLKRRLDYRFYDEDMELDFIWCKNKDELSYQLDNRDTPILAGILDLWLDEHDSLSRDMLAARGELDISRIDIIKWFESDDRMVANFENVLFISATSKLDGISSLASKLVEFVKTKSKNGDVKVLPKDHETFDDEVVKWLKRLR